MELEPTIDQLDMEPDPEESLSVEDTEDGGAMVYLENEADVAMNQDHFANIVEDLDYSMLSGVVSNLLIYIDQDKKSREQRDKLYEEGLKRTGLGDDAPGGATFQGASRTVHPLLAEACVDFSARAMKELFPPNGPAKAKVLGVRDKDKLDKAQRKTDFLNWQCTEQITELRTDLEKLLTQVPLGGGQYLKLLFDQKKRRPTAEFVPIDDILLPFAASNFYSAERRTHVQRITQEELEARIKSGMYVDRQLPAPQMPDQTKAATANDKIEGKEESTYNEDGLRIVYEVSALLDLEEEGETRPYIISIDHTSSEALSVYRNWAPDDDTYQELMHMVEFPMIPWRGAYPIGLSHLIGGLTGASTGALRALLDSAHIQNLPTLLKLKSGQKGEEINVTTTMVSELESGLTDDIRKLIMAVPFNPPSAVLFQLLGFLVDAGKGVVQTSFEKLADMRQDAPVGTTLALIEQGLVVFSSIHSRMHHAMGMVLKILHRINGAYLPAEGVKEYGGEPVRPEDFDGPLDVIPVSDPNVFSDTQRFAQVQAVVQRSAALPQLYDQRKVEELFLRQLKVPSEEVLLKKEEPENMDPASENVAMTSGANAFVLPYQDHLAHLRIHMDFAQSQVLGANPVMAQTFMMKAVTHIRDHVLHYYLSETHKAVATAIQAGMIQEDDANAQAMIIVLVQKEIDQALAPVAQLLAQLAQQVQAMMPKPPQDNSLAVAEVRANTEREKTQANLQVKQAELGADAQATQAKLQLEADKTKKEDERERIALQVDAMFKERQQQLDAQAHELKAQQLKLQEYFEEMNRQLAVLREDREDRRTAETLDSRERMNESDNTTAKQLAALETLTGEKVAVSTGTGINPNP